MTVHNYLAEHREQVVDQLVGWMCLHSGAGMPEHDVDLLRSANLLVAALHKTGFPTVEVCGVRWAGCLRGVVRGAGRAGLQPPRRPGGQGRAV
ncbi:hypothetical protein ACFQ1S_06705, partial [Kibdelosporangium lantanae]